MLHYLSYALFIGGVGAVLGLVLGIPAGQGMTSEYAVELGIPQVQTFFYPDVKHMGFRADLLPQTKRAKFAKQLTDLTVGVFNISKNSRIRRASYNFV